VPHLLRQEERHLLASVERGARDKECDRDALWASSPVARLMSTFGLSGICLVVLDRVRRMMASGA
jgi:hypothetical protein